MKIWDSVYTHIKSDSGKILSISVINSNYDSNDLIASHSSFDNPGFMSADETVWRSGLLRQISTARIEILPK